jgi:hypothetical protein
MAFAGAAATVVGRSDVAIAQDDITWWDRFIATNCAAPLDGTARSGHLSGRPNAIALGVDGSLLIADSLFHCIRKVDAAGMMTTIEDAGPCRASTDVGCLARASARDFLPNGADASCTARRGGSAPDLMLPLGITVDRLGNIFIADTLNSRVVKLAPGGTLVTIAGTVSVGIAP